MATQHEPPKRVYLFMLRWWTSVLCAVTCHAPPPSPATPVQRAMPTYRHPGGDYDFSGDVIEGDLVHPDGIID
jgi:hypothetical protein